MNPFVKYHPRMRRFILVVTWLAIGLTAVACSPYRQQELSAVRERADIHERLSELMIRDGFMHEFRSTRSDLEHRDAFLVKLTLDSVKSRHPSLEKMLKDIGRICANPGYANLPIRIAVLSPDEDDRMFMFAILATAARGSTNNISVVPVESINNELLISTVHPAREGN